jgi:hypothetical protein
MRAKTLLFSLLWVACFAASSQAEITQKGNLRVALQGSLTPKELPRRGSAPIAVSVAAQISTANGKTPPQLEEISIAINRYGRLDPRGLPVCPLRSIQPATTQSALAACGDSLIGRGSFQSKVLLPEQAPFPSNGALYAYNGSYKGRPVIYAHVYGTHPAPTSYTLPFEITHTKGTFGTTLTAKLPQVTSDWGYITGISLKLKRVFSFKGKRRSYLSASCPAPEGFPGASFALARASFGFARGGSVSSVLERNCRVG